MSYLETTRLSLPNIRRVLADGSAWVLDDCLYGKASDGSEVCFGAVFNAATVKSVEAYLASHPSPDTW